MLKRIGPHVVYPKEHFVVTGFIVPPDEQDQFVASAPFPQEPFMDRGFIKAQNAAGGSPIAVVTCSFGNWYHVQSIWCELHLEFLDRGSLFPPVPNLQIRTNVPIVLPPHRTETKTTLTHHDIQSVLTVLPNGSKHLRITSNKPGFTWFQLDADIPAFVYARV